MQAHVLVTAKGVNLILTSYPSVEDQCVRELLGKRGIDKYIAFQLPLEQVREQYGRPCEMLCEELTGREGVRVLDYDGNRIFSRFALTGLEPAIICESCSQGDRAQASTPRTVPAGKPFHWPAVEAPPSKQSFLR